MLTFRDPYVRVALRVQTASVPEELLHLSAGVHPGIIHPAVIQLRTTIPIHPAVIPHRVARVRAVAILPVHPVVRVAALAVEAEAVVQVAAEVAAAVQAVVAADKSDIYC